MDSFTQQPFDVIMIELSGERPNSAIFLESSWRPRDFPLAVLVQMRPAGRRLQRSEKSHAVKQVFC